MPFTDQDRNYLIQAIEEAERDPRDFKVGAVIVTRDQNVVKAHGGEDEIGKEHAEHRAINKCLERKFPLDGATLYTTLEPCVEQSRSPGETPCAVKILGNPISRVVIGLLDPDQRVHRRGLRKLNRKRIEVVVCDDAGLRQRIEDLMARFLSRDRPQLLECPPFPVARTFSGRHNERYRLSRWLCKYGEDGQIPIMLIHDGPGGTGKSTLAYVWMKRDVAGVDIPLPPDPKLEAKKSAVDVGWRTGLKVLWFSFYSDEGGGDFYGFLERAIEHFSDHTKRFTDYLCGTRLDWLRMAEDLRSLVTAQPSLIIWDGAERLLREYAPFANGQDKSQGDASQSRLCADVNVARFLWGLSSCVDARLLILSRLPFADLENRPAKRERLDGLSPEAAVDLLRQRDVQGSDRELRERAADYRYHPLSLSNLAAAVTNDFATTGHIREAPTFEAGVPMDRRRRHVLEVAFKKRAPHLQELLSRVAAIREAISPQLLNLLSSDIDQLTDHSRLGRDLAELARHGLLNKQQNDSGYSLHPLVREYAYKRLNGKQAVHDRLAEHYKVKPMTTGNSPVDRIWLDAAKQYFHHIARAGRHMDAYYFFYSNAYSSQPHEQRGRDLNHILFYELGKYHDYLALLGELFPDGIRSLPDVDKRAQPFVLNDLALAYLSTGNLKIAQSLLERGYGIAVELVKSAELYSVPWAGGYKAMGQCLETLGEVKLKFGDLKGADRDLRRSIKCYSNLELAARCRQIAGSERIRMGDFEGGNRDIGESRSLSEQFSRSISYPFRQLAHLFIYSGDWNEGKAIYEQVRKVLETVDSKDYFYDVLWTQAALHNHDVETAEESLRLAETKFEELDPDLQYQRWQVELKYLRGEILLTRDELQDAEDQFGAALSGSYLSGDLEQECRVLLALARVTLARALRATNDADFVGLTSVARDLANQAEALAQRCSYALMVADTHLFLAKLSAKLKDINASRQHAMSAKKLASCGYRRPTRKTRYYRSVYEEARRLLNVLRRNKPQ